jgi:hypothetical protein
MKFKYCLMGVAASALLLGCDQNKSGVPSDTNSPAAPPNTNKVVGVGETKDDFVASMDKKLRELDDKISELAKKSEGYKDDAKTQADKALASLRDERDTVSKKLDDLKKSGQEAWEQTKVSVVSAWHDLESAFDNAKAKFQ